MLLSTLLSRAGAGVVNFTTCTRKQLAVKLTSVDRHFRRSCIHTEGFENLFGLLSQNKLQKTIDSERPGDRKSPPKKLLFSQVRDLFQ